MVRVEQQLTGLFDFQLGKILFWGHMVLLLKHIGKVIGVDAHGGGDIRNLQIVMVMQLHILPGLIGDRQAGVLGIVRSQLLQQRADQAVHHAVGAEMGGNLLAGKI